MALPSDVKKPIYGALVYFAPEGETIEAVTVAKDAKPAGSVYDDWESLGCIEELTVSPEVSEAGEPIYCFNATTGKYELEDTENTDGEVRLMLSITCNTVTPYILQMSMAASAVGVSDGTYTPASQRGGAYKGWLKVQQQKGTSIVNVLEIWCEIRLAEPAVVARRQPGYTPSIDVTMLEAADNAGVLGTGWA